MYMYVPGTAITISLSLQDGQSSLMLASKKGHVKVVEMLISAGAKVDLQDKVTIWEGWRGGGVSIWEGWIKYTGCISSIRYMYIFTCTCTHVHVNVATLYLTFSYIVSYMYVYIHVHMMNTFMTYMYTLYLLCTLMPRPLLLLICCPCV